MRNEIRAMIKASLKKDEKATAELVFFQIEKISKLFDLRIITNQVSTDQKAEILQTVFSFDLDKDSSVPFCIIPSIGKENAFSVFSSINEIINDEDVFVDEMEENFPTSFGKDFFIIKNVFAPKIANTNLFEMKKTFNIYKSLPTTFEEFIFLEYMFGDILNMYGIVPFYEGWRVAKAYNDTGFFMQYPIFWNTNSRRSLFWRDEYIINEVLQMLFRERVNLST